MDSLSDLLQNEEYSTMTLTMEDDTVLKCLVATIFEINGQNYICLQPLEENGEEVTEPGLLLYRFALDENQNPLVNDIEDEEELALAQQAAMSILEGDMDQEETEEE